jgi:hypothetical protein
MAGFNVTVIDPHLKYHCQFQITRCTRCASSTFASAFSTNEKSAPPLLTHIKCADGMSRVSPGFSLPQHPLLLLTMSDYSTPSSSDTYGYSAFNTTAFHPSPGPDHLDSNSNTSTGISSSSPESFESHSPPIQLAQPKLSALFVDQVAQQYNIADPSQLERLHVFFGVSQCLICLYMLYSWCSIKSAMSLSGPLSAADLGTRIQMLAAIFSAQNQVIEALPSLFNSRMGLDFKSLFKDLETRLQDSFKFTAEQSVRPWFIFLLESTWFLVVKHSPSCPGNNMSTDADSLQKDARRYRGMSLPYVIIDMHSFPLFYHRSRCVDILTDINLEMSLEPLLGRLSSRQRSKRYPHRFETPFD